MASICLIAEADPFIANLLQRFAEESGVESAHAKTGEEVLELVRLVNPDVLILEPDLPGEMRGWEALKAVRASDGLAGRIPVISCSWMSLTESARRLGHTAGHLQKPDLHYADFVIALLAAGVGIEDPANLGPSTFDGPAKQGTWP